jgi:hypothetical protein
MRAVLRSEQGRGIAPADRKPQASVIEDFGASLLLSALVEPCPPRSRELRRGLNADSLWLATGGHDTLESSPAVRH